MNDPVHTLVCRVIGWLALAPVHGTFTGNFVGLRFKNPQAMLTGEMLKD